MHKRLVTVRSPSASICDLPTATQAAAVILATAGLVMQPRGGTANTQLGSG